MIRFRQVFYRLLPSWLGGGAPRGSGGTEADDERVSYTLSFMSDAWMQRLLEGLRARFPGKAAADALPYLGRDRKIVRGINEPADAWAERQLRWLNDHKVRGVPWALLDQLASYLQSPGVVLSFVDVRGNWFTRNADGTRSYQLDTGTWDWDGIAPAPQWSRFWILIYPTADGRPWAAYSETIGDATLYGGAIGAGSGTLGCTATPDQVATVRAIIKDWKGTGRCEWVIVAFDPASFDAASPGPDGTWGLWGKDDGSGGRTPTRLRTARYWKGVDGAEITT